MSRALILLLALSVWSLILEGEGTRLTLLHYNDFHSRFQPTDREGGECSPEENERQECFGGFARLKSKVLRPAPFLIPIVQGIFQPIRIYFDVQWKCWKVMFLYLDSLNLKD